MTLSKNITGKSWAVSFMAITLLAAAALSYAAYADEDVVCTSTISTVIEDISVYVNISLYS